MSQKQVRVYTDGGCSPNPGPGGWAVVIEHGDSMQVALDGAEADTTNNRMEMTAAIGALEKYSGCRIILSTDSQYLHNGIREWIEDWKANGWRTAAGKAVKNCDLWRRLDALASASEVHWQWVRGHSGNPGNEMADQAAVAARRRAFGQ